MAVDSAKHFRDVVSGPHYITKSFLSTKRLEAIKKRNERMKQRTMEIVESFKTMFCARDEEGNWDCVDAMVSKDEMNKIDGLSVDDMVLMLKRNGWKAAR